MKENQRVALTRRLVHEGLLRMLKTVPVDRITVSALCAESGINRSTFYMHYGCPEDVLREIELQMICDMFTQVRSEPRSYAQDVELICRYIDGHAGTIRLLMRSNVFIELPRLISLLDEQTDGRYADRINGYDPDSLALRSTFICYGAYHMVRRWLTEDIRKTPQEVARLICQLTEQGFGDAPQ